MKILAFDTSTQTLGIALYLYGTSYFYTAEGGAHASDTLIPQIAHLLNSHKIDITDLNAIAFGAGPGAFTGLRTAASVAQGIALGANLPVIPIVTLQAGAQQYLLDNPNQLPSTNILVQLDARMGEWYWAHYQWQNNQWHTLSEPILSTPDVLLTYIEQTQPTVQITISDAQMSGMLELAKQAWQRKETVTAEQALPLYLRNKVALTTIERMTQSSKN